MTAIPLDLGPPWDRPAHRALLDLAAARGLAPRHPGLGQLYLGEGARLCRIDPDASDRTSFLAAQLCRSRLLTHRALAAAGLPVPVAEAAQTVDAAVAAAGRIGGPVVLRQIRSHPPTPPTPPLQGAAAVADAFRRRTPGGALVAAAVPGRVRRLLVVDGRWRPLAPEAEPPHALDRLLVERAALVCGIEIAVVELTGAAPDRPFTESGAMLTALDPGFLPAAILADDPAAVAAVYLDHLYPDVNAARIPIVAVAGADAEPVAAEVAAAFAAAGLAVGIAGRAGLVVDGLTLMTDDRRGGAGLSLLVDHGGVEAAVVTLADDPADLGHPSADVLVCTGPPALATRPLPRLRRGVVGLAGEPAPPGIAYRGVSRAELAEAAVAWCDEGRPIGGPPS